MGCANLFGSWTSSRFKAIRIHLIKDSQFRINSNYLIQIGGQWRKVSHNSIIVLFAFQLYLKLDVIDNLNLINSNFKYLKKWNYAYECENLNLWLNFVVNKSLRMDEYVLQKHFGINWDKSKSIWKWKWKDLTPNYFIVCCI